MIKKKNLFIIFIFILSLLNIFSNTVIAMSDPITDPNSYRPGQISDGDASAITSKAGIVVDIITTVGIIVATITLLIIGIKYMVGSVEEKAEYKKTMIPYLIGVIMIGSISGIIKLIAGIVEGIG